MVAVIGYGLILSMLCPSINYSA